MISLLSGNSRILLTVDERGSWAQLFFPYPGLHQQLQQTRVGLFDEASKEFTWIDQDGAPPVEMGYVGESDAARTRMHRLGLEVTLDDMVHPNLDLVIRRIALRNPGPTTRTMRIFHYQSLSIQGSLYQGTAYWDSERKSINHYKASYYFQLQGRPDFDHYSCGEHTLKGLLGSYVDAEDGELGGSQISHGAADSVVQWNIAVPPGEERWVHLLVMIGRTRRQVNEMYRNLSERDPALFTAETVGFGNHWASRQPAMAPDLSPRVRAVYRRSLFVMRDCQASNGSVIASPDSRTLKWGGDTYNYCWWRDGAYIAKAMSTSGLARNATRFLDFASQSQEEEGYFLHRHLPDGSLGSTWHPPPFLQADQTASVIDAVHHHYQESGNLDELLQSWPMVRRAADFLMSFVDEDGLPKASFDLWEEKKSVNTYTVSAVVRALRCAAAIGRALAKRSDFWADAASRMHHAALERLWNPSKGTFLKSLSPRDDTIDASALLALTLDFLPATDPRFAQAVQTIEARLGNKSLGGISRYEGDQYYGVENPWLICTLWLAQCHLKLGNADRCRDLIEWCASQASPTDLLPEQIDSKNGEHTSVTPLVWSHSTFVDTVSAYSRRSLPVTATAAQAQAIVAAVRTA